MLTLSTLPVVPAAGGDDASQGAPADVTYVVLVGGGDAAALAAAACGWLRGRERDAIVRRPRSFAEWRLPFFV